MPAAPPRSLPGTHTATSTQLSLFAPPNTALGPLSLLSSGLGQDSHALLLRLIHDPAVRAEYAPGHLAVVTADTGDEHPPTLEHMRYTQTLCARHNIPYDFLTTDRGYHRGHWALGLVGQWRALHGIGSVAFPRSCTHNLKIAPINNYLDFYLHTIYRLPSSRKRKAAYHHLEHYGPVTLLIGFAKGEEKRRALDRTAEPKWRQECVRIRYPLIDLGMDRRACQEYARNLGEPIPPPSACRRCHFQTLPEILLTYRLYPAEWAEWVACEAAKIARDTGKISRKTGKPIVNNGVYGTKLLPAILAEAERRFGHLTTSELEAHRFSHGHCVRNKY